MGWRVREMGSVAVQVLRFMSWTETFSSFGLVLDYPMLYTLSLRSIPLSTSVQTTAKAGAGDLWALASGPRFWHRLHGWTTSPVSTWGSRPIADWHLQCSITMWRNAKQMACLSRQTFWDTQMENKSFFFCSNYEALENKQEETCPDSWPLFICPVTEKFCPGVVSIPSDAHECTASQMLGINLTKRLKEMAHYGVKTTLVIFWFRMRNKNIFFRAHLWGCL